MPLVTSFRCPDRSHRKPRNYAAFGGVTYSLTIIPELPGIDLVKDLGYWLR